MSAASGRRALGALAATALLVTACTGDAEPDDLTPTPLPTAAPTATVVPSSPSPTATGTATPTPTAAPTTALPSPTDDDAAPPFEANTEPDTEDGSGPIAVTNVRVGWHDGYDRIVFDIEGDGEAGWTARYVDEATAQGSGETIELDGEAVLDISITGAALPGDIDATPFSQERVDTDDLQVVVDMANDNIYEGYHHFVVGLAKTTPFRVFSLDDPQRVVLDIQH